MNGRIDVKELIYNSVSPTGINVEGLVNGILGIGIEFVMDNVLTQKQSKAFDHVIPVISRYIAGIKVGELYDLSPENLRAYLEGELSGLEVELAERLNSLGLLPRLLTQQPQRQEVDAPEE